MKIEERTNFRARFRYRAVCPHCAQRLSRRHFFNTGRRACDNCGRSIESCDNRPILWSFGVAFSLLIMVTMFLWQIGWGEFSLGVLGVIVLCGVLMFVWPYTCDFRAAPEKSGQNCPRCGYDLRATPDRCPECGLEVPPRCRQCGYDLRGTPECCPECGASVHDPLRPKSSGA